MYVCLKIVGGRERETCSNDHMKIYIEQRQETGAGIVKRNNKTNKTKRSLVFCLEQCIVENKPKTDTHTTHAHAKSVAH